MTCIPATVAAGPCSDCSISSDVRFRSDHGLRMMPEKPNDAAVSWKEFSYSGTLSNIFCTSRE
jgi:hypothetical protein